MGWIAELFGSIRLQVLPFSLAAGLLGWFLRRAYVESVARRRLIRALFAEIDFNTRDMETFRRSSPSREVLQAALGANPDLVPHVTDARHTEIYRQHIASLHFIPGHLLHQVIDYYGLLEKIRVQVEGLNYDSYKTLSLAGRVRAVDLLRTTSADAETSGKALMAAFRRTFPRLKLTRYKAPHRSRPTSS
jgi:hypothetical protein